MAWRVPMSENVTIAPKKRAARACVESLAGTPNLSAPRSKPMALMSPKYPKNFLVLNFGGAGRQHYGFVKKQKSGWRNLASHSRF